MSQSVTNLAVGAGVSEETTGAESASEGPGAGAGPVAVALALGGADREEANAFLRKQARLADLQAKELAHELELRHWSMLVRHLSGLLKLTLEVGLAVAAIALASFLGAALWNAAHADGLVIESFSVPPDLAERGLTGQVIAGELLDRLTEINQSTLSARTGKSYAASWGDEIKVEIPETGISVAEAYRFLRRWLGHESHISGAVWHSQGGIVITARSDGKSVTVTGPDADIGGQIQKAAEAVFGLAEPYRYGVYILRHGRNAEAIAAFRQQAAAGPAEDRAWGLTGLAAAEASNGDIGDREVVQLDREAAELDPSNTYALISLSSTERTLSRLENAANDARKLAELLGHAGDREISTFGTSLPIEQEMTANGIREFMGAYGEAIASIANILRSGNDGARPNLSTRLTIDEIRAHDLKAARGTPRERDRRFQPADRFALGKTQIDMNLAAAEQNWPQVVAAAVSANLLSKNRDMQELIRLTETPVQAYAEARLGRFGEAEALIATTPGDCDECMLMRARIAELQGQHARADWWFARVVHDAPSIPLMYATWGQALLERGQPDAAIAQFTIANRKGPHFADPLEGWGEALMAKSQSHLALAKFAEANKYAPNWGRLHLKWGEALYYTGRKDEARAQFARAAQLDLTPAEKSELQKVAHV
jgi:tetratricopeptide (TPR) repeat protein